MQGSYKTVDDSTVEITKLPVSTWIREYKNYIETLIEKNEIKNLREFHTENRVHFIIEEVESCGIDRDSFIKKFKLELELTPLTWYSLIPRERSESMIVLQTSLLNFVRKGLKFTKRENLTREQTKK